MCQRGLEREFATHASHGGMVHRARYLASSAISFLFRKYSGRNRSLRDGIHRHAKQAKAIVHATSESWRWNNQQTSSAQAEGIHESPIFLGGSSLKSETKCLLKCRPHGEAWGGSKMWWRRRERSAERLSRRQPSSRGGEQQFSLSTLDPMHCYTHFTCTAYMHSARQQ